jgi:hypothetical protein
MTGQRFTAVLEGVPTGGAGIRLPFDPKAELGKTRAPVRVSIGAHPPFSTTVMVYSGVGWVGLRKGQVTDMSLHPGDQVEVIVELDDSPREVEVPEELAAALGADPEARAAFERLPFSHRREYVNWVAEAKRPATKADRAAKTVQRLKEAARSARLSRGRSCLGRGGAVVPGDPDQCPEAGRILGDVIRGVGTPFG